MDNVQTLATRFVALTGLSLRKNAALLGITPPTLSSWMRGGVDQPQSPQGREALAKINDVLQFEAATGGVSAARQEPRARRFDLIKGVIDGAFR